MARPTAPISAHAGSRSTATGGVEAEDHFEIQRYAWWHPQENDGVIELNPVMIGLDPYEFTVDQAEELAAKLTEAVKLARQ